jgi:hypothetical protein
MADHFADRYWSTQFWSVRYFQGGEQPEGAMQALLAGASSLSAALSTAGSSIKPGFGRRRKPKYVVTELVQFAIPANVSALIEASSTLTATATANGFMASRVEGAAATKAGLQSINWNALDAEFWLIAA